MPSASVVTTDLSAAWSDRTVQLISGGPALPWAPAPSAGRRRVALLPDGLLELELDGPDATDPADGQLRGSLVARDASVSVEAGVLRLGFTMPSAPVEVSPDHADIGVSGGTVQVELASERTLLRMVGAGARASLRFDLVIPSGDPGLGAPVEVVVPAARTGRSFTLTATAETTVDLLEWTAEDGPTLAGSFPVEKASASVARTALLLHQGHLLAASATAGPLVYGPMRLEASTVTVARDKGGILLRGVRLALPVQEADDDPTAGGSDDGESDTVRFSAGLSFDAGLVFAPQARSLRHSPLVELVQSGGDTWLRDADDQPFTVRLHADTRYQLSLDPAEVHLLALPGSRPAATVYAPGVSQGAADQLARRFELRAPGHAPSAKPPTRLLLAPGGLELTADVKTRPVVLGLGNGFDPASPGSAAVPAAYQPNALDLVQTTGGHIAIAGGDYLLRVEAEGALPFFRNAGGRLEGMASSRGTVPLLSFSAGSDDLKLTFSVTADSWYEAPGALAFRFTPDLDNAWVDSSGLLALRKPELAVQVAWKQGGRDGLVGVAANTWDWLVESQLSGRLLLRPAGGFGSGSQAWMEYVFADTPLSFAAIGLWEFKRLELDQQHGLAWADRHLLSLQLRGEEPPRAQVYDVLELELRSVELAWEALVFGGWVKGTVPRPKKTPTAGKKNKVVSLELDLPKLVVGLEGGRPSLGLAGLGEGNFAMAGELVVGEALTFELEVERTVTGTVERIGGSGTLACKGLPAVRLSLVMGRVRANEASDWEFMMSAFGGLDYPVPLFKGVVLREYGLGFGVSMALDGLETGGALERLGVKGFVEGEVGFPDPASQSAWVDDLGRTTFVARTFVAPEPGPRETPQVYLLEAILVLDDRFNVVFMANGWMLTSIADASSAGEVRDAPLAKGAIVLYPRSLTIEGFARTQRGAKQSLPIAGLEAATASTTASFSFLASPTRLALVVGPIARNLELGLFQASTALTVAAEVVEDSVAALAKIEMHASMALAARIDIDIGIFEVSAGVDVAARFDVMALFAGGLDTSGNLTLYTKAAIHLSGSVRLWLRFSFKLDLGFWTIRISKSFDFSLSIVFDAQVRGALVGDDLGMKGDGRVTVRLMGFALGFSMAIAVGEHAAVDAAERQFEPLLSRLLEG